MLLFSFFVVVIVVVVIYVCVGVLGIVCRACIC